MQICNMSNPQKSVFSYNIYKSNQEDEDRRSTYRVNSSGTRSKFFLDESKMKAMNILQLKECSTQTSKTIVQLAQQIDSEGESISPDSLCRTPRNNISSSMCRESHKLMGKSLTQTFLEKNKKRDVFGGDYFIYKQNQIKSKSNVDMNDYIEPPHMPPPETKMRLEGNTPMLHKQTIILKSSPRFWNQVEAPTQTSFMCSTMASKNKNIMAAVQNAKQLISPTRRGRSMSPQHFPRGGIKTCKKIPYIDQSVTNFSSETTIKNHGQHSQDDTFIEHKLKYKIENKSSSDTNSSSIKNSIGLELARLRNLDWNTSLRGLAGIVELCRVTDIDSLMPFMTMINQRLLELLKSPRSYVCRTACQAAGHLFEYVQDTRRPEFDDIVDTLLVKTADSNKFIRQDANLALDCMVTHIPMFHAVRTLCSKGPIHKNALVRTATARLITCAVVITGADAVLNPNNNEFTRKKIFLQMVKFLEDKNLETRIFGKRLYKVLQKENTFDVYFKKYIEKDTRSIVEKKIKYIQKN